MSTIVHLGDKEYVPPGVNVVIDEDRGVIKVKVGKKVYLLQQILYAGPDAIRGIDIYGNFIEIRRGEEEGEKRKESNTLGGEEVSNVGRVRIEVVE